MPAHSRMAISVLCVLSFLQGTLKFPGMLIFAFKAVVRITGTDWKKDWALSGMHVPCIVH